MKKLTYLLSVLTLMVFMSCSCEKDDPIVPDGTMTLSELEGVWISTQYEYIGTIYSGNDCAGLENSSNVEVANSELMLITANFSSTDTDLSDNCGDATSLDLDLDYNIEDQTIILESGGLLAYSFNILSYDNETETLVLRLIIENVSSDVPLNGVYTLQK